MMLDAEKLAYVCLHSPKKPTPEELEKELVDTVERTPLGVWYTSDELLDILVDITRTFNDGGTEAKNE